MQLSKDNKYTGNHMEIECHDIAVNTLIYRSMTPERMLGCISEAGAAWVEFAFTDNYSNFVEEDVFTLKEARRLSRLLADSGLRSYAIAAHTDLGADDVVDRFKRRMEFTARLGARMIITNASTLGRRKEFLLNVQELSVFAEKLELVIALENPGDGEGNLIPTGKEGALLMREIDSPYIGLNYDYCNAFSYTKTMLDPDDDVPEALRVAAHLHLKDMAESEEGWKFCAVGDGVVDYSILFNQLKDIPRPIPMSLELPLHMKRGADYRMSRLAVPPDEGQVISSIRRSLSNISRLAGDMR